MMKLTAPEDCGGVSVGGVEYEVKDGFVTVPRNEGELLYPHGFKFAGYEEAEQAPAEAAEQPEKEAEQPEKEAEQAPETDADQGKSEAVAESGAPAESQQPESGKKTAKEA